MAVQEAVVLVDQVDQVEQILVGGEAGQLIIFM
jgi:hypothetical protein